VQAVGVVEVLGTHEECLQTSFRTRDDSRVISEQQTAEDGYKNNGKQVAGATCLSITCHMIYLA
jgi:hypothetical protein